MSEKREQLALDEIERQHYVKSVYVTLKHPATGKELQINIVAMDVIETMKKAGYVELTKGNP